VAREIIAHRPVKVDQISALPFVIIGIVAIIFVSWWLYGTSESQDQY